jgi:hypothetical protein
MNPSERLEKIETYGRGSADLENALKEFPKEMWQYKPSPADWSIHEQVIHIADSETNAFIRFRRAVAEPGSGVYGYDQDRWTSIMDYHSRSIDLALNVTRAVRESTYALLKSLPESVFANTVEHSENGTMTLDDVLNTYAAHIPGHIDQMRGVYEHWKQSQNKA